MYKHFQLGKHHLDISFNQGRYCVTLSFNGDHVRYGEAWWGEFSLHHKEDWPQPRDPAVFGKDFLKEAMDQMVEDLCEEIDDEILAEFEDIPPRCEAKKIVATWDTKDWNITFEDELVVGCVLTTQEGNNYEVTSVSEDGTTVTVEEL